LRYIRVDTRFVGGVGFGGVLLDFIGGAMISPMRGGRKACNILALLGSSSD
jgi:hypothetical protein